MRVQHNIMAMGAYRNYTNNVAAMKKNLERLSSGYKINRAGDDAAGLAISEKMRAQITGLETAQKNAKDGISLVQTAEGALTEVHDMLNRMVELATMSANGTYDNTTDRAQLQKELDQLRSEINRIADSANFNGIKLLNGDMDGEALTIANAATEGNFTIGGTAGAVGVLPAVKNDPYADLGVNTVLHTEKGENGGSTFGIDFHDFSFSNKAGDTLTITLGEGTKANVFTIKVADTYTSGTELTGGDLASMIEKALKGTDNNYELYKGTTVSDENQIAATDELLIQGQNFRDAANYEIKAEGTVLTFTQKNTPADESEEITAAMKVNLRGVTNGKKASYTVDLSGIAAKMTADGDKISIKIGTKTIDLAIDATNTDIDSAVAAWNDANASGDYTLAYNTTTKSLTITATKNGVGSDTITASYEKASSPLTGTGVDGTAAATASAGGITATSAGTFTLTWATNTEGGTASKAIQVTGTAETSTGAGNGSYSLNETSITNGSNTYNVSIDKDTGEITIKAAKAGTASNLTFNVGGTITSGGPSFALSNGTNGTAAKLTYSLGNWTDAGTKLKIGEDEYELGTDTDIAAALADILATDATVTINGHTFKAAYDTNTKNLTLTEAAPASGSNAGIFATALTVAGEDDYVKAMSIEDKGDLDESKLTYTAGKADSNFGKTNDNKGTFVGDYNVQTVNPTTVKVADKERLASTWFELTAEMVKDGAEITIGSHTYKFTTDKKAVDTDTLHHIYIGDVKKAEVEKVKGDGTPKTDEEIADEEKKAEDAYVSAIAQRLAAAAKENDVWSVGAVDGSKKITLVEKTEYAEKAYKDEDVEPEFDLRTEKGIEKSLGFNIPAANTEVKASGKSLTLQIGDTADDFNQLKVNIKDTHCKSLGADTVTNADGTVTVKDGTTLKDISIADQDSAATAVDVIKRAINQISDIRGTLGATQNRLDHTINNLSVMTENIQDAESTIRDTDIAEEMMAYTKNNILIQSAQAMLAQANQVPQGVLQLLQ